MAVGSLSCLHVNIKGLRSKISELKHYIEEDNIDIICLNETWLCNGKEPLIKGYECYWLHRDNQMGGGVGILVKNSITQRNKNVLPLRNGMLEVMAVEILLKNNHWLTIASIYNPVKPVQESEIKYYLESFGSRFVVYGDFNAHSPALDGKYYLGTNVTGRSLDKILLEGDVVMMNPPNMVTYVDYKTGKLSCLDLCIASSNIAPYIKVHPGLPYWKT